MEHRLFTAKTKYNDKMRNVYCRLNVLATQWNIFK